MLRKGAWGTDGVLFQMLRRIGRKFSTSSIDLRSDTVTQPCAGMRQAMLNAPLGDDVFGDDPSVLKLERFVADFVGKPAALYVPSGTMGNLLCIAAQCQRGDEIILGNGAHIVLHEGVGASAYLGVSLHTVPNQTDGTIDVQDIQAALREDDVHYPRTSLVAIENTHNTSGGRAISLEKMSPITQWCHDQSLPLHMDGARLANASVALQTPIADFVQLVDSVSLCLSKGLGAPVGSVIAGSEEMIYKARRARKSLGGGMRQAGILAAAGLYALENNISRLAQDHDNAKTLARGLAQIDGICELIPDEIDTNIVYFGVEPSVMPWNTFVEQMQSHGIAIGGGYGRTKQIRMVVHRHITSQDIQQTLKVVQKVLG